jgi:hypothetical protein
MKTLLVLTFAFTTALASSAALAAGGCGPGWHRGPHGRCLRNFERPYRHACPRGYHLGRFGRCRPNF